MGTERDPGLARARAQRADAEQLQRDPPVNDDAGKALDGPDGERAEQRGRGEREERKGG